LSIAASHTSPRRGGLPVKVGDGQAFKAHLGQRVLGAPGRPGAVAGRQRRVDACLALLGQETAHGQTQDLGPRHGAATSLAVDLGQALIVELKGNLSDISHERILQGSGGLAPCWPAEGREPIEKWLAGLSTIKRDAVVAALSNVLARRGPDVCESEWGKNLGQGLYEFRIRHTAEETAAMFAGGERGGKNGPAIVLRVFFHAHGKRVILLLGGYDKGRDPSERRQQREIKVARGRLVDFRTRQRAARPSNKRAGRGQEGA
jgi:hypothetical protein